MASGVQMAQQRQELLNSVIVISKNCVSKYSGKTVIAAGTDNEITELCEVLERIFLHGIKTNNSILGNVTDFLKQQTSKSTQFWNYLNHQLTQNEKERFKNLKNVWTDRGKTKSFIRNCLNEQSLNRYVETIMFGENIHHIYEDWAVLRDERAVALLPKIANDLSKILFAISIDSPELNVQTTSINIKTAPRTEPIIVSPVPSGSNLQENGIKKEKALRRQIVSFDETTSSSVKNQTPVLIAQQPPKPQAEAFFESFHNGFAEYAGEDFLERNRISSSSSSSLSLSSENISVKSSASSKNLQEEFGSTSSFLPPVAPITKENTEKLTNPITDRSMQEKLTKKDDHILQLEKQIADLILENSRLKSLLNHKVNPLSNFLISIPQALLQKTKTKNYYCYEIHIRARHENDDWVVLKRYRDFYKLHKKLKKEHVMIKTLDFPKKNIINMDFEFVEQRRQRLQVYLRNLLTLLPELSTCDNRSQLEIKFPFLK